LVASAAGINEIKALSPGFWAGGPEGREKLQILTLKALNSLDRLIVLQAPGPESRGASASPSRRRA
jgi:hypothetical protein